MSTVRRLLLSIIEKTSDGDIKTVGLLINDMSQEDVQTALSVEDNDGKKVLECASPELLMKIFMRQMVSKKTEE